MLHMKDAKFFKQNTNAQSNLGKKDCRYISRTVNNTWVIKKVTKSALLGHSYSVLYWHKASSPNWKKILPSEVGDSALPSAAGIHGESVLGIGAGFS